jgi:hypothetical protein
MSDAGATGCNPVKRRILLSLSFQKFQATETTSESKPILKRSNHQSTTELRTSLLLPLARLQARYTYASKRQSTTDPFANWKLAAGAAEHDIELAGVRQRHESGRIEWEWGGGNGSSAVFPRSYGRRKKKLFLFGFFFLFYRIPHKHPGTDATDLPVKPIRHGPTSA